jgi:hypothetical protein
MKKLLTHFTDALLDLWVGIVGTPRVPSIGEIYALYSESPFDNNPQHVVEVTDIRDGWVQYRYVGNDRRSSMRISSFLMVYELEVPVRCDGGNKA